MQGKKHCKKHRGYKYDQHLFIDLAYIIDDTSNHVEIYKQILPASKYMLSESKYCWECWTIMFFEKFLQQISHFESFFHVVILLQECVIWIFPQTKIPFFLSYINNVRPDSYQLFASLPHVWKWWHGFDFLASPHPILQALEALFCKYPTPKQPNKTP